MNDQRNANCPMLEAIQNQHPEWVSPDGDCPPCESYLHELAASTNHHQPEHHES